MYCIVATIKTGKLCFSPCALVTQLCLTLCDTMDNSPPGFSVHGDSPGRILVWGAMLSSRGIFPTQGLNPGLPHLQTDSLSSETPWKPTSHHIDAFYLVTFVLLKMQRISLVKTNMQTNSRAYNQHGHFICLLAALLGKTVYTNLNIVSVLP